MHIIEGSNGNLHGSEGQKYRICYNLLHETHVRGRLRVVTRIPTRRIRLIPAPRQVLRAPFITPARLAKEMPLGSLHHALSPYGGGPSAPVDLASAEGPREARPIRDRLAPAGAAAIPPVWVVGARPWGAQPSPPVRRVGARPWGCSHLPRRRIGCPAMGVRPSLPWEV